MMRVLDKDIAELSQKIHSSGKYEKSLFMPTSESISILNAEIDTLVRRINDIDISDPVYNILSGHFTDFIEAMRQSVNTYSDNPSRSIQMITGRMYSLCCMDYRPDEQRRDAVTARFQALPQLWHDGILPALDNITPEKLRSVLAALNQAKETAGHVIPKLEISFKSLSKAQIDEIRLSIDAYLDNIGSYAEYVGKMIDEKGNSLRPAIRADDEVIEITQEEYRNALKNNIGVDLDEILSWYEYENAKTRLESLDIAGKIGHNVKSTAEVSDLLFKHAGPCDSPEEMFLRANLYLKRARAAAHDYIWLPENEVCECVPIPEQLKDSYPWGGYSSDWPSRYPLYNTMFLNNHNYTAITDGWIKINALHEAYPGHHAQFLRAAIDPIPETMKRGAKHVAHTEGVCIRTERAFEFVFPEDSYYPLMTAHRRHHTSTRIKIDLMLNYFGKTIGEACNLYQKEMGFERKTARAQVQAHENMTGYFTSYYYGMKKICDLEKQLCWDKREYTELLFSYGRISLDTFEKIVKLNPNDRHSLRHDFASLIQFS